jgi:hypothetical protein
LELKSDQRTRTVTRRTPTLSIFQRDRLCQIAERLTPDQRNLFWSTVTQRLRDTPSDAQVARVGSLVRAEIERPGEILRRA